MDDKTFLPRSKGAETNETKVREILVQTIRDNGALDFATLFEKALTGIKGAYHANTGEERLRLRTYTILQKMQFEGAVARDRKLYSLPKAAGEQPLRRIRTEDGYTLDEQADGSWTDGDMKFDSLDDLKGNIGVDFEFIIVEKNASA